MSAPRWESLPIGAHLVRPRLGYWHHGVHAGDGHVIHDVGFKRFLHRAPVEEVSLAEFLGGRELRVQVSALPRLAAADAVARARSRLRENNYRIWPNNSEHFASLVRYKRGPQPVGGWINKALRMMFPLRGTAAGCARPPCINLQPIRIAPARR